MDNLSSEQYDAIEDAMANEDIVGEKRTQEIIDEICERKRPVKVEEPLTPFQEEILEMFKSAYGEHFNTINGPVGLISLYYGKNMAIESGEIKLGTTQDEIRAFVQKLIADHPKDQYIFSFFKFKGYKSEEYITQLRERYYEGKSRIPKENIPSEVFATHDSIAILGTFTKKLDYLLSVQKTVPKPPVAVCPFGSLEYNIYNIRPPELKFYYYYCDSLYLKHLAETQAQCEEKDVYLAEIPDKHLFYVKKTGYIRADLIKPSDLEKQLGDRFIEWIDERRISLRPQTVDGEEYVITRVDVPFAPQNHIEYFLSEESVAQLHDKLFETKEQFESYKMSLVEIRRVAYLPHEILLSKYAAHIFYDYWDYEFVVKAKKEQAYQDEVAARVAKEVEDGKRTDVSNIAVVTDPEETKYGR